MIENPAYAFCSLGTWTPPNSKKQASEITHPIRRRRRSFGGTSPTHSMPRRVAKQVFQRCGDQIHIEPSDPEPRASELISGESNTLFETLRS
jgi:hypothetical protein